MGAAWEIIDSFVTNPGGTITATTVFPGDTFFVRNFEAPNNAWLVDVYGTAASTGVIRIRSPRLHDNVQGIRFRDIAATNRGLLSEWQRQRLYAQDALVVEMSGGAAETDGAGYIVYYEDLPGAAARLIDVQTLHARGVNLVNIEVANTGGQAVGTRSASAALNASFDLLKANTDYAILGFESDTVGLSVGMRGVDTGNLRVGGPMTTERIETRDWFARIGQENGLAMIPIVNSANKGGFLIDNAQVVAGVAANITVMAVELSP